MSDSRSSQWLISVLAAVIAVLLGLIITGLVTNIWYLADYGRQLTALNADTTELKVLTQGLDGSLRPEGTLSTEMQQLKDILAESSRQQQNTSDTLDSLLDAMSKDGQLPKLKPKKP